MERLHEIELRKAEIKSMLESGADCDLTALETEVNALYEEYCSITESLAEERKKAEAEAEERAREAAVKADEHDAAERRSIASQIAERTITASEVVSVKEVKHTMEYRNTPEYVEAYAEYIKSEGKDKRSLEVLMRDADPTKITTTNDSVPNGTASIAVPDFVDEVIHTAWEREEILSRVRRTYFKGNLKINYEISGTDATIHLEGEPAIENEELLHGIVTLAPRSIKKVVAFSDEVYDMRGEAFLRYIYEEITYKVYHLLAQAALETVLYSPSMSGPAVATVGTSALSIDLVAQLLGNLNDEVRNPVIIMNKATWAAFKALQYAGQYPVDPFEGLPVLFNNVLPAFDRIAGGDDVAENGFLMVGDLSSVTLNFPNGDDIQLKFDDLTRKKEDMIEVLGRLYVGVGYTVPNAFAVAYKLSQE